MTRFLTLPRAFLFVASLGAFLWVWRSGSVSNLAAERERLIVHHRHLASQNAHFARELAEAEQANADAHALKKARLAAIDDAIKTVASLPLPAVAPPLPPAPTGPRNNFIFAELLDDPAYLELCHTLFRHDVDVRHGKILARFRSDPAKLTALTQLLIERRFVGIESEQVGARRGLSSIERPIARYRASDRLEDEIRALAGDELYRQLNEGQLF